MGAFRETFAPLRKRDLRIYLSGQTVSLIGTWMQTTAQSWVVWRLTGSESALGTVGMLGTLPLLLLGPIAGTLADRWDRRKILLYTQAVAMVLALILSALVMTGVVRIWHVYLLATLLGCVTALDLPSAQAFIGDLAGVEMVRRAVVINAIIVQISRILGPMLAGVVVKLIGEGPAFLTNGLSFVAVIASLLAVRVSHAHRQGGPQQGSGDFMEGVRYTLSQPRILDLMIFTSLVTFFVFSNATVLPSFATHALGGDAGLFGVLMGFSGAGALVSVLLIVPAGQRVARPGVMLAGAIALSGLFLILFSFTRVPSLAIAAYFFAGMPTPLVLTTNNGLLQVLAPPRMRARLLSLYLMLSFGLQPISSLWVGWVAERMGAPSAIRINGVSIAVIALLMLLRPGLLSWEPGSPPAAGQAAQEVGP